MSSDIYETLVQAIQQHWKVHANANPQAIALTASSWQALNATRQLVNESMAFTLHPGWEHSFQGVPIEASTQGDVLVAIDGTRQPLLEVPPANIA